MCVPLRLRKQKEGGREAERSGSFGLRGCLPVLKKPNDRGRTLANEEVKKREGVGGVGQAGTCKGNGKKGPFWLVLF